MERRGPRGFEDNNTFLVLQRQLLGRLGNVSVAKDGTFNLTVHGASGQPTALVQVTPSAVPAAQCWVQANVALFPQRSAGPSVHARDAGACCAACDRNPNCTSWLYSGPTEDGGADRPPPPPPPPPVHAAAVAGAAGAGSCCANLMHDTDVSQPQVIPSTPSRNQCNISLAACCALCDGLPECLAFVLSAPSSWSVCQQEPYCFLLRGHGGTRARKGNVVGGKAAPGPPHPPHPPPAHPNCALNAGYGEQHLGSAVFGCPRRGCDAAWSGRWQGGDLGKAARQPALAIHARVFSPDGGRLLGTSDGASAPLDFPQPSALPGVFALRDAPRIIVPEGGAVPQPAGDVDPALANTSGYDTRNDADDVYLFVVAGNYTRLKVEFLGLTGPVPRLPDWAFGTWFTEWHNYSQAAAEAEMLKWQTERLPLSVWGLDMNWRNNGYGGNRCPATCPQCEYYYNETNTTRLPNITKLFEYEHERGLKVYLNDHPHGFAPESSPFEVKFRYDGLASMLDRGLDFWWYDPNWHIGIPAPFNLEGQMWGAHVYTSAVARHNKVSNRHASARPIMLGMSNAAHPAAHRSVRSSSSTTSTSTCSPLFSVSSSSFCLHTPTCTHAHRHRDTDTDSQTHTDPQTHRETTTQTQT